MIYASSVYQGVIGGVLDSRRLVVCTEPLEISFTRFQVDHSRTLY